MSRTLRFAMLIGIALGCSGLALPQTTASLPRGAVIPSVAAAETPDQTYALYVPNSYSLQKSWPVVFVFDPLARGELALRQFEHAAELHGFIVAASNNSRNGPGRPQFEAAQAMFNDTQRRFLIDTQRMYFAGFSGGARVAAQLAISCRCAAGVLLSGAGFPQNASPSPETKFSVFSAVGNTDFNYREVLPLQEQLEKAGLPHWLRVFDGSHEWATPAVIDEALAWFRVQAMKSNLEPRSDEFISAQMVGGIRLALSLETSGALLAGWREYSQVAATFDSLADVSASSSKVKLLEKDKTLRDQLKRERGAFEEQDRLSEQVMSALSSASLPNSPGPPEQRTRPAPELARDLRQRSLSEKKSESILVLKRALGGVFIASIEAGNSALDKKDYRQAAQDFACAAEANPESEWVFRQLAIARAVSGDRKGAIEALRIARQLTKDLPAFSEWLTHEPALKQLRRTTRSL